MRGSNVDASGPPDHGSDWKRCVSLAEPRSRVCCVDFASLVVAGALDGTGEPDYLDETDHLSESGLDTTMMFYDEYSE